ncbi:MAG: hypothetical protein OET90_11095, partial [Desulfuromonadales bacterium]|nr:hypothetical protein [Desulfuromonadales bacterium]
MRRRLLVSLLLCGIVVLGLGALGYWAIGTTSGSLKLLESAIHQSGATLSISNFSGRLADQLHAQEVIIKWPESRIVLSRFDLDWRPFALLSGRLDIVRLEIDGLAFETADEDKAQEPAQVESTPQPINLAILPDWLE